MPAEYDPVGDSCMHQNVITVHPAGTDETYTKCPDCHKVGVEAVE